MNPDDPDKGTTFAELVGGVDVDPEQSAQWFEWWFKNMDEVGLAALTPIRAHNGIPGRTAFAKPRDMVHAIRNTDMLADLAHTFIGPANLYGAVSLMKAVPEGAAKGRRGGKHDVSVSPGWWIDLDVGPGKLGSLDECLTLSRDMWSAGLGVSGVVATGSGGLHVWGRVGAIDGVPGETGESLSGMVAAWARAHTGVGIDRVANRDRVMRLPGSIRWPKSGEPDGSATQCKLLYLGSEVCDIERLEKVCADAWAVEIEERIRARKARELWNTQALSAVTLTPVLPGNDDYWGRLIHVADAAEMFAEVMAWESVLEPFGWELLDGDGHPDYAGRRTWTRPDPNGAHVGPSRRSLLTDWSESPHVATLKSESPETGLLRLHTMGLPLTKVNVWVELAWQGDWSGFMTDWRTRGHIALPASAS